MSTTSPRASSNSPERSTLQCRSTWLRGLVKASIYKTSRFGMLELLVEVAYKRDIEYNRDFPLSPSYACWSSVLRGSHITIRSFPCSIASSDAHHAVSVVHAGGGACLRRGRNGDRPQFSELSNAARQRSAGNRHEKRNGGLPPPRTQRYFGLEVPTGATFRVPSGVVRSSDGRTRYVQDSSHNLTALGHNDWVRLDRHSAHLHSVAAIIIWAARLSGCFVPGNIWITCLSEEAAAPISGTNHMVLAENNIRASVATQFLVQRSGSSDGRFDRTAFKPRRLLSVRDDRLEHDVGVNESPDQPSKERMIVQDAWPMFHHDMEHTGLSRFDTRSDRGNLRWKFPVASEHKSQGPIQPLSSPALGRDDTIYVGSSNGVSAINRYGILKWTFRTNAPGESSSPAIGSDGTIYFGSMNGNLYAIDLNGRLKWKFPTHGVASSPTVGRDGTIYFGSFDGNFYALNPNGSRKWVFKTDDKVPIIPALASDGTIYFSGGALNPNGTLKWRFPPGIASLPRLSPPAVASDGTIYFGGTDNELHAFRPDGTLKWKFLIERGYVFATPAIGRQGTLYFGVNGGLYFYALRPDGDLKWKFKTEGNVLSSAAVGGDGTVYYGSEDGHFYALNPRGRLRWKFPPREPHEHESAERHRRKISGTRPNGAHDENSSYLRYINAVSSASSPAIGTDGTIYFASLDGHLYALH